MWRTVTHADKHGRTMRGRNKFDPNSYNVFWSDTHQSWVLEGAPNTVVVIDEVFNRTRILSEPTG